jgi:DNA-binding transcriptional ArsR family regulator
VSGDALKAFTSLRPHLPRLLAAADVKRNRRVSAEALAEVGRQLAWRYDPTRRGYVDDTTDQLAEAIGMSPTKVERCLPVLEQLGLWMAIRRGGSRDRYGSRRIPGPELCAAAHRLGLNLSTPQSALALGQELTALVRSDTQELTALVRSDTQELTAPVRGTHRTGAGNSPHQCGTPKRKNQKNPPTPLAAQTQALTLETGRTEEIVNEYVRITLEQLHKKPNNPRAYAKTVIDTALGHPDLRRWMREYPHVPANQIAAWMHGDKHSMQYVKAATG